MLITWMHTGRCLSSCMRINHRSKFKVKCSLKIIFFWPILEEQVYTQGDPWLRYSTWRFIDIILSLTREWLQFHQFHHPAPLLRGFCTACPFALCHWYWPCHLDLGALLVHPSSFLRTPENHSILAHDGPLSMQYLKLFVVAWVIQLMISTLP